MDLFWTSHEVTQKLLSWYLTLFPIYLHLQFVFFFHGAESDILNFTFNFQLID